MFRVEYRVSRGFRQSMFGLVAVVTALAVATGPVDARRRYYRHYHAATPVAHRVSHHSIGDNGYSPPSSSIVVDANTGKTLDENSADGLRHPASLTKIMTLYLLFERLDAGKIKLNTMMPISEHAAEQSPTKLGLRPGQSLEVEDAIRGLVTRSANDAAVVIAEAIGGDEDSFAEMMTHKAHALGMSRTTYRNASGLPDDDQVTTARDQALLGRAIQERFPKYYRYFSTPVFVFRGEEIRNHNHLLGQVEGVDGIKTGYTRASGFNLVTSVTRNDRHIVAVVMGGSSAGARDARMRDLIAGHFDEASTRHTATAIAEASEPAPAAAQPRATTRTVEAVAAKAVAASGYALATVSSVAVPPPVTAAPVQGPVMVAPKRQAAGGSSEPIKPIAVKTIKVKLAPIHTASLAPAAVMIPISDDTASTASTPVAEPVVPRPTPTIRAAQALPAPKPEPLKAIARLAMTASAAAAPAPAPAPSPVAAPTVTAKIEPIKIEPIKSEVAKIEATKIEPAPAPTRSLQAHSGWIVQIGAYASASEAKQHLDVAQSKAKTLLGRADPFTETVTKGDKTLYRARFAGLEKDQAEATCRELRRSDMACMTVKN
jgi:D-alanyl-D-alanine carboxypeptidase